jgi:hypothetical protein
MSLAIRQLNAAFVARRRKNPSMSSNYMDIMVYSAASYQSAGPVCRGRPVEE